MLDPVEVLAQGAFQAFLQYAHTSAVRVKVIRDRAEVVMRGVLDTRIDGILADWRQAIDAGKSESDLWAMVEQQAKECGLAAWHEYLGENN